jgi:hypothetical protein
MADLQSFAIIPEAAAQVNVPTFEITALVIEGQTVIADFTGGNSISFPGVMATLSVEQRQEIMDLIAITLVLMKAGLQ